MALISALLYNVHFPKNCLFGNCIFAMRNTHFGWIVDVGYSSNPLKKFTFRSLILNFWPTFKNSIQARHLQFGHLQIIVDLRMQYAVAHLLIRHWLHWYWSRLFIHCLIPIWKRIARDAIADPGLKPAFWRRRRCDDAEKFDKMVSGGINNHNGQPPNQSFY